MYTLFGYWRSSASYRLRIALNLKGLSYSQEAVHLVRDGGEQHQASFRARNPHGLVPVLRADDQNLTQSLAILEFLEERHPAPPLLPDTAVERAWARAAAQTLACEIHPLNNLRVLKYLVTELGASEETKLGWYRHWVEQGLAVVESHLAQLPGDFSLGEWPGYLEACLVPQVYNARRFQCELSQCPTVVELDRRCNELDAFREAAPERQPDAE
ncbi:MAG: maleylacetoacetate isomerase [Spiribacter salinus]|uniref:Maleylacetoacetate isomerase n=1 Tax=Spiribacter salinus TaxID=1335746 RepID=A0A540VQU3_9GAMM|nr:MAG: maleylacetoacetate isomerase [Spiribacter salinus]